MNTINCLVFRDSTAFLTIEGNDGILTRLLCQLPDEFAPISPGKIMMFNYTLDRLQNYINEFFNPEVIQIRESSYNLIYGY